MSEKVELSRLLSIAQDLGTTPMLLSVDGDGRPRAAAVAVTWTDDTARVRAGRRTVANAAARPLVSLLWPAPPGQRFALLVDGTVTAVEADADERSGGYVSVQAGSGILHVVDRP